MRAKLFLPLSLLVLSALSHRFRAQFSGFEHITFNPTFPFPYLNRDTLVLENGFTGTFGNIVATAGDFFNIYTPGIVLDSVISQIFRNPY
jgi:hypothetical protein